MTEDYLKSKIRLFVQEVSVLKQLYSLNLCESEFIEELDAFISSIVTWINTYMNRGEYIQFWNFDVSNNLYSLQLGK